MPKDHVPGIVRRQTEARADGACYPDLRETGSLEKISGRFYGVESWARISAD
jgi:hypothetical protein